MATYTKYNVFVEDLANKIHDIFGTTDTFKVILSNTAPNVSTHAVRADVTELGTAFGYTSGGIDVQNDSGRTGGTVTVSAGVDPVWTAAGGSIGPFRYAILYNDTPASDPLIGYWDYGQSITLESGQTFTVLVGTLFTLA